MLFTSGIFLLVFLPVTYAGFLALWRLRQPALLVPWLIGASMLFYAWWSPRFLGLLVVSMLGNYGIGRLIQPARQPWRRTLLVLGVAGNLGALAAFKYADFFIGTVDAMLGAEWTLLHLVLPLGISFFTFQKIAYLADIHAGTAHSAPLLDFSLFVFFFPQLIAGPIVHHSEVMPQFRLIAARRGVTLDAAAMLENCAVGLTLLLIGLVKKVLIADPIAGYASPVFDAAAHGMPIGLVHAWEAMLGYTVQLYFDFSGYSDMAIGLARLFGVRLPANFNSPYKSCSIIDFWRRWHMTLSRFLRDYLYVPLGGNRKGPARRQINLMIVMLLGGLWHGAGWTFVLWGGLHGLYLLVAHGWRRCGLRLSDGAGWCLTILAVALAWVLFRASDVTAAAAVWRGLVAWDGLHAPIAGHPERLGALLAMVLLMAFAALAPNSQQIMRHFKPVLGAVAEPAQQWARRFAWSPQSRMAALLGGAAAAAVALLSWKSSEFLYFQF